MVNIRFANKTKTILISLLVVIIFFSLYFYFNKNTVVFNNNDLKSSDNTILKEDEKSVIDKKSTVSSEKTHEEVSTEEHELDSCENPSANLLVLCQALTSKDSSYCDNHATPSQCKENFFLYSALREKKPELCKNLASKNSESFCESTISQNLDECNKNAIKVKEEFNIKTNYYEETCKATNSEDYLLNCEDFIEDYDINQCKLHQAIIKMSFFNMKNQCDNVIDTTEKLYKSICLAYSEEISINECKSNYIDMCLKSKNNN